MSDFDESKHNRERDGKFATKVHAEADRITLQPSAKQVAAEILALPDREAATQLFRAERIRSVREELDVPDMQGESWPKTLPEPEFNAYIAPDSAVFGVQTSIDFGDHHVSFEGWGADYEGSLVWDSNPDTLTAEERQGVEDVVEWAYQHGVNLAREVGGWDNSGPDQEAATEVAFGRIGANLPGGLAKRYRALDDAGRQEVNETVMAATINDHEPLGEALAWPAGVPEPTRAWVEWHPGIGGGVELQLPVGRAMVEVPEDYDVDYQPDITYRSPGGLWTQGAPPMTPEQEKAVTAYLKAAGERTVDLGRSVGKWNPSGSDGKAAADKITG